jgi:hypothetical protein
VDQGQRLVQQPLRGGNLSAATTCKHVASASSSTRLQLMGGDEELGEPGKNILDTPGPTVLEDPRDGARAASPSQGLASATSISVAPFRASLECGTAVADATSSHRRATETNEA